MHISKHIMLCCVIFLGIQADCGTEQQTGLAHTPQTITTNLSEDDDRHDMPCDLEGIWGVKFTIPVAWSGNVGIKSGRGEIIQWVKSSRKQLDDGLLEEEFSICGVSVPDYQGLKNELYGVRFPNAMFDADILPHTYIQTHVSALAPGATYHTDYAAVQLGIGLKAPLSDAWPVFVDASLLVDSDQDGYPGVTLYAAEGPQYAYPPANLIFTKRAKSFYAAVRNVAASSGIVASCHMLSGVTMIPVLHGKPALNSHVLGCMRTDGVECDTLQTNLLDLVQPTFLPNGKASVTMQKLDADITCADIRKL